MEQHRRSMGRVDALQTSTCCSSRAGSSATLPSASSAGAGSTQVEVADPKGSSSGKALQSQEEVESSTQGVTWRGPGSALF